MNNQESYRHSTQSQEPLNFLKTVVSVENGQARSDSDKENDNSNNGTQEFSFDLSKDSVRNETISKEDSEMWEEFYNEDEFEGLSGEKKFDEYDHLRSDTGSRVLEKVEEEEEEDNADESYATDTLENSSKECTSDSKSTEKTQNTNVRKKRKKRLFRKVHTPAHPSRINPIGGSHPNLGQQNDVTPPQGRELETMSETSGVEKKLNRRKQVSRPHCAGPAPQGDRLQQKYQELEQLMLKPLASPAVYVQQTRHQMLRLQGLSTQPQAAASNLSSLPPAGLPAQRENGNPRSVIQIIDEDTNQAYSIVCNVQDTHTAKKGVLPGRRPMSGQRLKRPQSAGNIRPRTADSAGHSNSRTSNTTNVIDVRSRGRLRTGGRMTRKLRHDSSNSEGSNKRSDGSGSESRDVEGNDSSNSRARSRSGSKSPGQTIIATDNHLKNSSNPALRQWLKIKDKEFRKQKLEERKKKRKERLEKQEEEIKKQEILEKGEEKVKEWMSRKRKEAWQQAREDRRRRIEEEKQFSEQQNVTESLMKGKQFIPIKRPEGKYEKQMNGQISQIQSNDDSLTSQPKSKFVYKRPVSGRVRLMKLQQDWKDDTKKQEAKKKEMDQFYAAEKERKMRVSYDQWLLKKREEDYAKRQALAKERALAKSDPELQNIVPEMARRRIENIKRGKKRVDSGISSAVDKKINQSFGGGDFDDEEETKPTYRLRVVGDKKSLKQRPSSAKAGPTGSTLNPKQSKSPRRPQSAHPRVEALMDESQDPNPDNSGFKVPFPPALGVPKYVASKQEKLFSQKVISDSVDGNGCGVDGGNGVKRVSESEQDNLEVKDEGKIEMDQTESEAAHARTPQDRDEQGQDDALSNRSEADEQSFFLTDRNTDDIAPPEETQQAVECDPPEDISLQEKESKSSESVTEDESFLEEKIMDKDTVPDSNVSEEGRESTQSIEEDDMENNSRLVPPLDIGDDTQENDYNRLDDANMDVFDSANVEESVNSKPLDNGEILDSPGLRSSIKHVSFSEENIIHEDPLIGIANDEDFFDDYADHEPPADEGEVEQEQEGTDAPRQLLIEDDNLDHEILDEIEGYQDEDDEAEDERGNYFDCDTPRDNDAF